MTKPDSQTNQRFFRMEYYNTYYFTNILQTLLADSFSYLRTLEDFFGDSGYRQFLVNFPKYSALHLFIEFVIETDNYETISDVVVDSLVNDKNYKLWVNNALNQYDIEHIDFHSWLASNSFNLNDITEDTVNDYHSFLRDEGPYDQLIMRITDEVFFLMFMNREFLREFNNTIALYISNIKTDTLLQDEKRFFKRDGFLKRINIPVWARRAIFFRDRGLCSSCHKDISGLISIHSDKHFDHIVPLARGGINDVTNIQLLCEKCNLQKKDNVSSTSKYYERWYI